MMFRAVVLLLLSMIFFWTPLETVLSAGPLIPDSAQTEEAARESAQQAGAVENTIVFVNADLIPMDREMVVPKQTVIIRGNRITAIGPVKTVGIPVGAMVIDATGHYLVPGLVDAHVHLGQSNGAWSDFGDAPLFLSYGITTVFNLRGDAEHLAWKEKIRNGEWLTPNLYTAGSFIDDPCQTTPDGIEKKIVQQVQAGYDLIKYHECDQVSESAKARGLSKTTYRRMDATAARLNIPLIGHAPHNLGFQALLQSHQSLSHVGELVRLCFFSGQYTGLLDRTALISFALIVILFVYFNVLRWNQTSRKRVLQIGFKNLSQMHGLIIALLLMGIGGQICLYLTFNAEVKNDNIWPSLICSALNLLIVLTSIRIVILTRRALHRPPKFVWPKIGCVVLSVSAIIFTLAFFYWTTLSWRLSGPGLKWTAQQCREAGIRVQSTLVCNETLSYLRQGEKAQLLQYADFRHVPFTIQKYWEHLDETRWSAYNASFFKMSQRMIAGLHRAGVPLMAGTDAMGCPFIIPGSSLHRELQLLLECGLTPYEVLWAATAGPAQFLKKQDEFGTIEVGKRADLILVAGNPLADLTCLKQPLGVMVRGKWLTREQLDKMLADI